MINAVEYGRALFMLTEEVGNTEEVREDVMVLRAAFCENPGFSNLLDTPAISKDERIGVVNVTLASMDKNLVNLVKILAERRQTHCMPDVLDAYLAIYDEAHGIERVEAITVMPLTTEQAQRLEAKLEKQTGKKIIIENTVDPSILGGIKLRYMGIQLDSSLKTRLDSFEKSLMETII